MARYASKVVEQAQAWLGCKESDGSHKKIIDVYNAHKPLARNYKVKYTDAWCATFVSAVAIMLEYTDIIPTECSCTKMIELLKKIDSFVETDSYVPSPGDILFYDWDDSNAKSENTNQPDHVGIVEKVSGGKITVIEGNYDNAVKRRTLDVNGKFIRGYGVPKYDVEPVAKPKTIDELALEVIAGKHGSGNDRKKSLGNQYEAVQNRVNEMLAQRTHTVVKGDTLWAIAKKYLGDSGRYPEIMKLNGLKSTVLRVNQKLKIPKK